MLFQHIIHPTLDLTLPHGPEPLTRLLGASVIGPDGMISTDEDQGILLEPFGEIVGVLIGDGWERSG